MRKRFRSTDYWADDEGNVWSGKFGKWRLMKGGTAGGKTRSGGNYRMVKLRSPGKKPKGRLVHRMVWEVFNGRIPEGLQINHKDGNKRNNHLDNLELVTHDGNMEHGVRRKLFRSGADHPRPNAKITEDDVRAIRKSKKTCKVLGDRYGVSTTIISKVKRRILWKHVED